MTRVPDLDRWEETRQFLRLARSLLALDNPEWRAHAEARRLYLLPAVVSAAKRSANRDRRRPLMTKVRKYRLLCPIARALDLVGDRWALLILRDLHAGPARFNQLFDGLTASR